MVSTKGSTPSLRQETAALRDFGPTYVAYGSENEPARAGARCARSGASGEGDATNQLIDTR
jgi:hypothetical protein